MDSLISGTLLLEKKTIENGNLKKQANIVEKILELDK